MFMELKLSCVCCGSTEFVREPQPCYDIGNESYLLYEDIDKAEVTCIKCGLRDNVANLIIKYN